jgi:dUTP pyrophosphatase
MDSDLRARDAETARTSFANSGTRHISSVRSVGIQTERVQIIMRYGAHAENLRTVNNVNVKIKLEKGAKAPVRSTTGAAGYDIFAHIDFPRTLLPGHKIRISTGISVEIPRGHYWDVRARSGISIKHGLMLLNGAGVIDEDYRGIIQVAYYNSSSLPYTFTPGEKIAQVILQRYYEQEFEIVDELEDSERGIGGFGSTGR